MHLAEFSAFDLVSITVLARWFGFGLSSPNCNRLVIQPSQANEFESFDAMNQSVSPIDRQRIDALLDAIRLDCPCVQPHLFGRTQEELDFHFGCSSTDDCPAIKMRIEFKNRATIELSTHSNRAHLLPWTIRDPTERLSYNPRLSMGLAELLPTDFLCRDPLFDPSSMFDADRQTREEIARMDAMRDPAQPEVSFESQRNRIDELLMRLADVAVNGEAVDYQGTQFPYTAEQLRQLSEQQLRELVQSGFDLSASDETGQTALMLAAFPPFHKEQFQKLVRAGADVNAVRTDGLSGLMLACAGGEEAVVKEWLLAGACVNLRGPHRSTALMLGAKNGEIVSDLLNHGAKVTDTDDAGDSALDYAMEDLTILWAGKRLRSIELLSAMLATTDARMLSRSYERALVAAHKIKLGIEIEREFGGRPLSDLLRDTESRSGIFEFIDLAITEYELVDRILETILMPAVAAQSVCNRCS